MLRPLPIAGKKESEALFVGVVLPHTPTYGIFTFFDLFCQRPRRMFFL